MHLEFEQYAMARGEQLAVDVDATVDRIRDRTRDESHPRVALSVEEIGGTQVLVALVVAGVEASRVDRELETALTLLVDLQPSAEAVEATLDLYQTP